MASWFITRHHGAVIWAQNADIQFDHVIPHFSDLGTIQAGDCVYGTLPIHLAAQIGQCGGRYFHLAMEVPPQWRGQELTPEQMDEVGARFEEFIVTKVDR